MKRIVISALFAFCTLGAQSQSELDFLYQYMPLPDSTDYPREFWQQNVDMALRAREEMPWGKTIPEREWRHFVLPVRVNNENLDDSRTQFYETLKKRVKGLSMYDAVLEVNHWCHEKVSYHPSDARTRSPLATVNSAQGRCGEESTFLVAALRTVGIPARQVYTPRWAHTDDNHAWVEAWVDGQWYFLGACEPEPVLNLGWFNAPASRAMLMHTKAFGHYDGPEEVMSQTKTYTEIDVTDHYAPVSRLVVKTTDAKGKALPAKVEYKLYNYAEFYTLATKTSDSQGFSHLTTGRGDLLVWASYEGRFGYAKASVGQTDTLTIVLDKDNHYVAVTDLDVTPPAERNTLPQLTTEQTETNRLRLAMEDSIRALTIDKFNKQDPILINSRGNQTVIKGFRTGCSNPIVAEALLESLAEKDLVDVTMEVLYDHYSYSPLYGTLTDEQRRYVLCPRVSNEMLTPYKAFFQEVIPAHQQALYRQDPHLLAQWFAQHIHIDETANPQHLCMHPTSVWTHGVADAHSRDICYVSAARSMGIASRIDEVTGKVQFLKEGQWQDVHFQATQQTKNAPQGELRLTFESLNSKQKEDPCYYTHFTLSRMVNGTPQLLSYPEEGITWQSTFAQGEKLDAGQYLLTSGTRLANGSVLAHMQFFEIEEGKTTELPLIMRQNPDVVSVIGSFNSDPWLPLTGRGYFVLGLVDPLQEPSKHATHDIQLVNDELQAWGRPILIRTTADDPDGDLRRQLVEGAHLTSDQLPIFIIADTFNRVVFVSQGYTIGLGQKLLETAKKL